MENKKEYLVRYYVDISEDNYENGVIENNINYYDGMKIIKALNKEDAIKELLENTLYFSFNKDYLLKEDEKEVKNKFYYSVLVDDKNCEVLENDRLYKEWTENKINLFLSDVSLLVNKLEN